jgi:predicted anti-sigma-YlaC factor YlaD
MNCNQIRELLPELALGAGIEAAAPEVGEHIASCKNCAAALREFQQTMALLDEWQAPEPSPYFDTRLQARLREELAKPQAAWLGWLRHPAWVMSLAAVLFAGALTLGVAVSQKSYIFQTESMSTKPPSLGLPVQPGTAVGDLQALDRNDDLYADFDTLDELQVQDNVTANP